MILSASTLRRIQPVRPFCERNTIRGMSYGLSLAGYDVRVAIGLHQEYPGAWPCVSGPPDFEPALALLPGNKSVLVSTLEEFNIPNNVVGIVHSKSTWARRGLTIPSVVLEPGWRGHLTLALVNTGPSELKIVDGDPIAQVVFHLLDSDDCQGYSGKYQGQGQAPTPARFE